MLDGDECMETAEFQAEQARWQQQIYELLNSLLNDPNAQLDGTGCESGDPLDVTLQEITQAFSILEERYNR